MVTSKPVSTRARILGSILIVACVGLAIVGTVTFAVERARVARSVDERLSAQADVLRTIALDDFGAIPDDDAPRGGIVLGSSVAVDSFLETAVLRLAPASNGLAVAEAPDGSLIRPYDAPDVDVLSARPFLQRVAEDADEARGAVAGTWTGPDRTLRYVAMPVTTADDASSGVYVYAIDLTAELAPVTAFTITFAIAAAGVLLAVAIVGWVVAGRLLSPIRHLRNTAEAVTIVDLGARLPTGGNDDISDLTRTVNSMFERLESSVDMQRRLLDDVRHELKTPITIVRGHLETMDTDDADDVRFARQISISELDRMTRLVNDIDLLASVEGDQFTMSPVDLHALTRRMKDRVVAIPGHDWSLEHSARGSIVADSDRLLQAWLQLADNAAKYSPDASPIEFGSDCDRRQARLWVRDHGPGIPASARHRIFRRFDRAHTKRAVGGSGLGLAIVDTIAKAHGGRAFVDDTPGGGATFVIEVPGAHTRAPAGAARADRLAQPSTP